MAPRNKNEVTCEICGRQFFKTSIEIHRKQCIAKQPFLHTACPYCDGEVQTRDLEQHIRKCEKAPPPSVRRAARREAAETTLGLGGAGAGGPTHLVPCAGMSGAPDLLSINPIPVGSFRVCGGLISVCVCVCDLVQCAAELLPGIDLPNTKVSVGESVRMGPPMPRPWCRHPHGQPTPSRFGTQTKSTAICADGRSSRHRSPFIESSVSRSSRLFRRHAHTATVR
jgi:hypothetical protein